MPATGNARRIMAKVDAYAANPIAFAKVKALANSTGKRLRVGDFRVICEIQDGELRVLVVELGNRREVYR